jgi:hypothetical protein
LLEEVVAVAKLEEEVVLEDIEHQHKILILEQLIQ